MKRTTGVLLALVCSSSLAIAQGGPDRGGDRGGGDGGGFSRGGGGGEMRGGGGERGFGGGQERSMGRSAPEPRAERAERPEPRAERPEPRAERRERQTAEPREPQEPKRRVRAERNDSDRKEALDRKREARDADRASRDKEQSNKDQADAKDKRDRDGASSAEGRGEGEGGRGAESGKVESGKRGDTADRATSKRDRPAQLAGEKRDRVRTVFRDKGHAKHRTGVNINISLGRRLPRDWDFYPVPIEVVEIVPEYRDYVFVYVDDDYVICDPDTYEVVAVIPVGDGPSYAGGGSGRAECSRSLALNRDERDLIVELARSEDEVDVDDLEVGWSVPRNIELHEFTGPVLERADELGACRYFVADDSIAVVDPDESKVVLVIDRS
jgi:hypothetical protein